MRRFLLGCVLAALCALPFGLKAVEAVASADDGASTVRTVASDIMAGGITTDAAGRIYLTANDRVYRVSKEVRIGASGRATLNGPLELVAGNGERGSLGDGGPALLAQLDLFTQSSSGFPSANGDLAADNSGNLFLADAFNDTVRRIDAQSLLISSIAGRWATGPAADTDIGRPRLVAADASGNLYVATKDLLWRLDASDGPPQSYAMSNPVALAVSRDGTIVVAAIAGGDLLLVLQGVDLAHSRVTFTARAGGSVSNVLMQQSEIKKRDFSGLAIDDLGNIFAAEGDANTVSRIDAKTMNLTSIAGDGRAGYFGDGGSPLAAQFNTPAALAIDRDGNLFVADTGNLAVREITHAAASAGVMLAPNTFTFPDEPTGGSSAPQLFTLTNDSSVQVTGIAIGFTGGSTPPDFTETSTCATTLDAGASCTISVMFSPKAAGNRSAALHVADSDPSSPQTAALAGFADDYELALQSGNTDTLTVIQGSTANYNLAVVPDDTFSGTVTIQCPVNLPLDASCALAAGSASSSSGSSSGASGPTTLALNVTAGTLQNFTVALSTMAKNQAIIDPLPGPRFHFPAQEAATVIIAAIVALFACLRIRQFSVEQRAARKGARYGRLGGVRFALATVMLVGAATGCGGGGTPTLKTKPNPGTPAGTYHFNVVAASQGASRAFTITLVVQTP
jgi:hypothetical protein